MKEPRRIWLVTLNGAPQHCAWALVKTPREAEPGKESWASALGPDQLLADGWDATPTQWRRVPHALYPGMTATLSGREVTASGLVYNLDQGGERHELSTADRHVEPHEPAPVRVDKVAHAAAEAALGDKIQYRAALKGIL